MITNIDIITFPVADQERARRFYVDVLGFEIRSDMPFGGENANWLIVAPPGGQTQITLATWFDGMAPTTGTTLRTTDIAADRAMLVERGLDISEVDDQPWGKYAQFNDPDGNGWVLVEPKD